MAASTRKVIVVVGATGQQGGSVAATFLKLPQWHVRALTRNPSSGAAERLADQGAEVVRADLAEPASLEKAFEGAHAIFVNTDFWGVYRPAKAALDAEGKPPEEASRKAYEHETRCGRNAADAAAAVPTLERFVYSALSPISKASGGRYTHARHQDAKGDTVEYIETAQPALARKTSLVIVGGYNTNAHLVPRLDPASGRYVLLSPVRPHLKVPLIDPAASVGPFVRALVEEEEPGVKLLAYDSRLTIPETVQTWSAATGLEAVYVPITTKELHEKMGLPLENLDGVDYMNELGAYATYKDIIEPHQLKSKVQTKSFGDWLKEQDWTKEASA